MTLLKDLTGQKFGRFSVIERCDDLITPSGNKFIRYLCLCDCGNYKKVVGATLRRGKSKSCGCYHDEITSLRCLKDLTDKQFGKWMVIRRGEDYKPPKGRPIPQWICQCECGNTKQLTGGVLVKGESKSCGCGYKSRTKDIVGRRFGKLVVKELAGRARNRGTIWKCQCDCGNVITVLGRSLMANKSLSCGCRGKESWKALRIKEYFSEHYSAIPEYRIIKNPKTGKWLPYDLYLPNNVFIEIQGRQHYEYTPYFFKSIAAFENRRYIDKYKKEFAEKYGTYIEVDLRKIKNVDEAIIYIEQRF